MVGSGVKVIEVPVPRTEPFSFCSFDVGRPFAERHSELRSIAFDDCDQFFGQRIDDRSADSVQSSGCLVVVAIKFPAGMQNG